MAKNMVVAMLALIASGKLGEVRDSNDNLVCINYTGCSTGIKYAKYVQGHMTVGATEEERQADEAALRKFIEDYRGVDVLGTYKTAKRCYDILHSENPSDEDIAYLQDKLTVVKEVEREVVRNISTPTNTGKVDIPTGLSIETLKVMKNEYHRNGNNDGYNACRRALRRLGYNC